MTKKGFSLVELLVVMSVLMLLISTVAMPVYSRAVAVARRGMCASNLHHLMTLLRAAREGQRERGEWTTRQAPFVKVYKWPATVAAETANEAVFLCPEDSEGAGGIPHPPLQYRSGYTGQPFLPFDPSHYNCVMRTGETEDGEEYTEYCIEENIPVRAEWEYALGVKEFSTNDGIWRIYHRPRGGRRMVVLTWYDCNWSNEIWVGGELYAALYNGIAPMTFYYDYAFTSFGYNVDLEDSYAVGADTIVLLDYPEAYVDATDTSAIYPDLDSTDSARHLGRQNVLYESGAVMTVGTVSLYPDINMAQWTADPDD